MDRDPPSCPHDPSSSDSKSDSDGRTRVGLGGDAGICKFRILDVQNLRDGGDGTEPESESSIVVVKVEPELTNGSPLQGEMGAGERRSFPDNALPTSNTIHVKEEIIEDSFNANEIRTPIFKMLSFTKNGVAFTENALQQHKEGDGVKFMDYKQKCIHGHEYAKIPTSEKIHTCTVCNQTFGCISAYQDTPLVNVKKIDCALLPPCQKSLAKKIARTNYVSMLWGRATTANPAQGLDPLDYGWRREGECLVPEWFSGPEVPVDLFRDNTNVSDSITTADTEDNDVSEDDTDTEPWSEEDSETD